MKKLNSIYLVPVIILIAGLACNMQGTAPATQSNPIEPTPTTAPAQETVAVDGPAGTEMIDLTNPALYIVPGAPAFTFEMAIKFVGVDTTGAAHNASLSGSAEVQTQPQISQRFLSSSEGGVSGAESAETVIIGDQVYSILTGVPGCNTFLASSIQGPSMLESMFHLQQLITGQTPRVESGIEVNGYMTDKYELSRGNFGNVPGELVGAFVYVVRDGGFITLYEEQHREKTKYLGFDPNQFTDVTSAYNFILVEDGSLDIVIPAECNKQAKLAGEFRVMDGGGPLTGVTIKEK